jgi:hypothetical protein
MTNPPSPAATRWKMRRIKGPTEKGPTDAYRWCLRAGHSRTLAARMAFRNWWLRLVR